ncbi:hypothetical protein [Flavobacterium rhizosphaerae]|uniref:Uncharacterized protein n=1 Tax=Flavobacterium rhizosphaerae TaxID=3163298 RepID=A0ABW8YRD9_9FLAO
MKKMILLAAMLTVVLAQAQTDTKSKTDKTSATQPEVIKDAKKETQAPDNIIDETGNDKVAPTPYNKDAAKDEHVKSYPDSDRVKDTVVKKRTIKARKS